MSKAEIQQFETQLFIAKEVFRYLKEQTKGFRCHQRRVMHPTKRNIGQYAEHGVTLSGVIPNSILAAVLGPSVHPIPKSVN
jgi:hypothetical protein